MQGAFTQVLLVTFQSSDQNGCASGSESEGRLRTSQSAPATGLNSLGSSASSRLPRAQNPTVTLLQKARGEKNSGCNGFFVIFTYVIQIASLKISTLQSSWISYSTLLTYQSSKFLLLA